MRTEEEYASIVQEIHNDTTTIAKPVDKNVQERIKIKVLRSKIKREQQELLELEQHNCVCSLITA